MLSHDDSECLAGLVREYIQHPFETFRRGIIRDFLEDKEDYRYDRVSHFDRVHERIMHIGPEMLHQSSSGEALAQRSIDNFPILEHTEVSMRRAYLCSLFRYLPIFRVVQMAQQIESRNCVEVVNFMETAWNWWMVDVGNEATWLIYRSVVVGEMLFSHLVKFDELEGIYDSTKPDNTQPKLRYEHYDAMHFYGRHHAANLNLRRWTTLNNLAVACAVRNYAEAASEISIDDTLSSGHDMVARNFNYNLWASIYSVCPVPRSR